MSIGALLVVMLALMACSGDRVTAPNMDATVEARVQEELAKADPTATPLPTETSTPSSTLTQIPTPTSTPTPSPVLPSSASILKKSQGIMADLNSFHYEVEMQIKSGDFELPMVYKGRFEAPESLYQTLSANMFGLSITGDFIKIGDDYYEKEFMGEWASTGEFEGIDPREFWTGEDNLLSLPIASEPTKLNLEGVEVYKISWGLSDMVSGAFPAGILSLLDIAGEGMPSEMLVEYWIETESAHLRKFAISMEGDANGMGSSGLPIEADTVAISMEFHLTAFNEEGEPIVAPIELLLAAPIAAAPALPTPTTVPTPTPTITATPTTTPTPTPVPTPINQLGYENGISWGSVIAESPQSPFEVAGFLHNFLSDKSQSGYFLGTLWVPFNPTLRFGNINVKPNSCSSGVDGYTGFGSIGEAINLESIEYSEISSLMFGTRISNCYEGLMPFKQGERYGLLDPVIMDEFGNLTVNWWLADEGVTDFSKAPLLVTPTPVLPTGTPTPTPTVTPTPTATPVPLGFSRTNPMPSGLSVITEEYGFVISIISTNNDAWTEIEAESMFNSPPKSGNQYRMFRLKVQNASGNDDSPFSMEAYRFSAVGASSVVFDDWWAGCGFIPDELSVELFNGGVAEGNICFEVPINEMGLVIYFSDGQNTYWLSADTSQ